MFLRQNFSSLIICWMDMLVFCGSVGSCVNFCYTICMEGSTGTDVNRAFTSKDVMNSQSLQPLHLHTPMPLFQWLSSLVSTHYSFI